MTSASESKENALLLDTHVLVWLVFGEPMLGALAREAIDRASLESHVWISAITPWEIGVLVGARRIDLQRDVLAWVRDALALPGVQFAELSAEIAVESTRLPWPTHADPADRILVATARHLGATLVTADRLLLQDAGLGRFSAMPATA